MSVSVRQQAKAAIRVASPWMEWLARLGYAAKGVVYVIIGVLAIQLACGEGGQAGGVTDAFPFDTGSFDE